MMKIYQGTDEEMERVARRAMIEALAIASGAWKKVIPLNGGSQTRRDSREYYHQLFHGSNIIAVESNGRVQRHTLERLESFVSGTKGKRLTYKALIQ